MTMTEYSGLKYDGMPKPPSLRDRIAALRKDEEVMAFLREMKVTNYTWVAEYFDGRPPISGGGWDKFEEVKMDCDYVFEDHGRLAGVRSVRILDALGAVVWLKEREVVSAAITKVKCLEPECVNYATAESNYCGLHKRSPEQGTHPA